MRKRTEMIPKLQIKSKKDWLIAFVFSFLLIYLIVLKFQAQINEFLLHLTPDKIGFFNQPEDEGVYAVTVIAVALLSIGVMIYKKVRGKYIARALVGSAVIASAFMGSYYYQCHLTLEIPSDHEPESVAVTYFDPHNGSPVEYTLDESTMEQLAEKVLLLEPLSGEEKEELGIGNTEDDGGELSVSIWYPRGGGYGYHIWVYIKDNIIRIHRGHSTQSDPVYRDNGLLEIIENLRERHRDFESLPGTSNQNL